MEVLRTDQLELGDTVCQRGNLENPFSTCVVTQITPTAVRLYRPYGITADFSYTGGVIPYTGQEIYEVDLGSAITWYLFSRKELK